MNSWSVQLLTLLGVVVGVLSSFLSSRIIERTRWHREQIVRWEGRRLDSYSEFASSLKRYISISHRIAAHLGLPAAALPIDQEEGLRSLAAIGEEISVKWEQMLLLASPAAIAVAREWRDQVWQLDSFTRGINTSGPEWLQIEQSGVEIRVKFYEIARGDLTIAAPPAVDQGRARRVKGIATEPKVAEPPGSSS